MVNLNCPVCKSQIVKHSELFTLVKDHIEFKIVECNDCQHVYTSYSSSVELQSYYDEKDYQVKDTRKTIFFKIQQKEYLQVLRNINRLLPQPELTLLDFGAGKGLFMRFAELEGFRVKGVETSAPRADYARETFGLDLSSANYHNGNIFNTKFDVITLFHVVEHLDNPRELLRNLLAENLKVSGVVVIEVPNFNSWQSQWAGKYWLHLDVPRHVNHFTPQNLKVMTAGLGFKIIKEEYFSLHLGVIGMIQSIWSWFGYKGFLIGQLKQERSRLLLLKIGLTLPAAFLIERIAAACKRGGIIRYYIRRAD